MAQNVFNAHTGVPEAKPAVLVVACSSNEYLPSLNEFIAGGLGLADGEYSLLAVPGGPQFIHLTEYLPKLGWAGQRWVRFLVERQHLRKVVLVAHRDCVWYRDEMLLPAIGHRLSGTGSLETVQRHDLVEAVRALRAALPGVVVEGYFAGREPAGHVAFEREA